MELEKQNSTILRGTPYVDGTASGKLLAANLELSFWGGVNPKTGQVIDRFHPLSGHLLKDTILAIPGGRGSCGGSVIMMELILNGLGPKALVFQRREEIITLGVIVAEELFGKTAPVVTLKPHDFQQFLGWDGEMVHIKGGQVSNGLLEGTDNHKYTLGFDIQSLGVQLSAFDRAILKGEHARPMSTGPGTALEVSLFGQRLRDWGGKFRVPSTLNALTIDHRRWKALGIDAELGSTCQELTQAFLDMGAKVSFTCAPYLLESAPKQGDAIAWGESNAVIYANTLIALTGRAPKAGVYLDENRLASVWITVQPVDDADNSFWPILGYTIGARASSRIPVITGLEDMKPSTDDFKAFSAAFATSSSAAMFHMVNQTPEAPTLESVCPDGFPRERIDLDWKDLDSCWEEFNNGSEPREVDLISFGNPHFSFQEIKQLAHLCRGRRKHDDVAVIVTCGRAQHGLATQAGYVGELEDFGVQFLTDACWCSIEEPVIPKPVKVIMTNSGKYIHYGPGLTGRRFCFGSLEMCAEAAVSGWSTGDPPAWLQKARRI
ncbi:hypothetical protein MRS44_005261 [Fusarium solani]|uniref:uncharacterized protein n=1 Tax=Fusarium solani TaxID=169388 RepID=UPI0032C493C1|nr:hypothetical protein MRS44_005261 [Fusarium solani]